MRIMGIRCGRRDDESERGEKANQLRDSERRGFHLTRKSSATAGENECELKCVLKSLKLDIGTASGWLQRLVRPLWRCFSTVFSPSLSAITHNRSRTLRARAILSQEESKSPILDAAQSPPNDDSNRLSPTPPLPHTSARTALSEDGRGKIPDTMGPTRYQLS